jgi:hypothetical protein
MGTSNPAEVCFILRKLRTQVAEVTKRQIKVLRIRKVFPAFV